MRDLEAEMVKALDGKFFWEQTNDEERADCEYAKQIRDAQKKFWTIKKKTPEDKLRERMQRLSDAVERRKRKALELSMTAEAKAFDASVKFLIETLADIYDVPPSMITSHRKDYSASIAKHHFVWSILRYFPEVSLSEIGRMVGKDHTTVMHSRKQFNKLQYFHQDKVAAVDSLMGYSSE